MSNVFNILIVDDSAVFRSQIRHSLAGEEGIEIVGVASNGKLAIEILKNKPVDLMVLDLEMPEMDGLQTLAEIKRLGLRVKVIVFSAHTKSGAEATLSALQMGAADFLTKPTLGGDNAAKTPAELVKGLLLPKIRQFQDRPSRDHVPVATITPIQTTPSQFRKANWDLMFPKVLVIASSTGGPIALDNLFSLLAPPVMCPVLIVQHMPPVFTASLAERLTRISGIQVREGVHNELIQSGIVYIAPGNFHMRVGHTENGPVVLLDQEPQRNSVRPAADFLFESAVAEYKKNTLGVVLTGMGADGKDGAVAIKQAEGAVMIQNKETCVVFGMPGAVFECGAYDKIGTLEQLAQQLIQLRIFGKSAKAAA